MADRRIRRRRVMWPWIVLVLLIVALIWLFLSPRWWGERVYEAPLGTDVRDLERPPVPGPEPGPFPEYDKPGEEAGQRAQ